MEQVRYEQTAVEHPAIDRLLAEYRAIYVNGGALLGCFTASGFDTAVAFNQWFGQSFVLGRREGLESFLTSSAVTTAFPELVAQEGVWAPEWTPVGPLSFGGQLGDALLSGGAYVRFAGTYHQARELGQAASDEFFGARWQEMFIWKSHRPWSRWFYDVAWDTTRVLAVRHQRRFWLLCLTDTD
jgi:hypothetical protein